MAIKLMGGRAGGIRMTAIERKLGRLMRGPDGHDDPPAGDPPAGDPPAGDPPAAPWYGELSAEGVGSAPSDRDWMTGKAFADPAAMVKAYRSLETKLADRKGIEVPGEDASDEQRAAFRAAIGVPENVEGYAIEVPEGWEADTAVLGPLAGAALEAGVPKAAFEGLAGKFIAMVQDQHNAAVELHNAERDAVYKEWGGEKDQNLELYRRGMTAFGFDDAKAEKIMMALGAGGTKFLFDMGLKLGRLSNEDGFIPGARRDFGITPEAARIKLAEREKDSAWVAKLYEKDPAVTAERNRLIAVISEDDDRRAREARAA